MFHLIYCSTAIRLLGAEELKGLLKQSVELNAREEITGFLVYHDGGFMQVLEGPEANVRATFARISRDRRHYAINTIVTEPIVEREFSGWHMAFRHVQDPRDLPA